MLEINPEKRLTAVEALESPWFDEVRKDFSQIYKK